MTHRSDDPLLPLLEEYARTRETSVRDEIVLACMDLVEHIANRYRFTGEPIDDIAQEGYIGLINAVEMFDVSRGVKFTTYASHTVQGSIQHYLRDKGKLIREPGWLHDLNQKINKAMSKLHQQLNRDPTVEEIAAELNLPDQQIAEAVRARDIFRVSSLEQPQGDDGDTGYSPAEREGGRAVSGGATEDFPIADRLALEEAIQQLRNVERVVVYDFFFNDLSKTEIAQKLGYSISHVSHILRRALKELKETMLAEERRVMRRQLRSIEGQLEHYARRVEEETIKDELTGLFNRRYLLDRLEEELARSKRYGFPMSVALMTTHGFAAHRAERGNLESERVLCALADILRESSRRIDRVGRYDETSFLLLLPHTGDQATVLCRRIQDRVAERRLGGDRSLAACFGIAVFPVHGASVNELMLSADSALRRALDDDGVDGLAFPATGAPEVA